MKCVYSSKAWAVALAMWLGLASGMANASSSSTSYESGGPTLQLGIAGGVYDWTTQTIVSSSSSFSLYAFLYPNEKNLLSDTYFLSMAVTPQTSTEVNLGSFTYNGNAVNVTSDMTYGTPPIDAFSSSYDPGDLKPHGVFPTYFSEVGFTFDDNNKSGAFNTQDYPGLGPQPVVPGKKVMYYNLFTIDISNLAVGYAIHFDLYNTKLCEKTKGSCAGTADTDITQFAPFSHDAQSMTMVPEPEAYAMLLTGLFLLGFTARRRKTYIT